MGRSGEGYFQTVTRVAPVTWAVGPSAVSATGRLDIGHQRSPQKPPQLHQLDRTIHRAKLRSVDFRCGGGPLLPFVGRCNRLQKEIALRAGGVRHLCKLRELSTTRQSVDRRIKQQ